MCVFNHAAITCSCNDDNPLTSCQWDGWTCTLPSSVGACFARRRVLDDGSIRHDLGCVLVTWNPTFCNADRTTETYAVQCCEDGDLCNENMMPDFLPAPTPPQTALPWSGNGGTATTYPVSTPTSDHPQG